MKFQFSLFTRPNGREAQRQDEARLQSAMLADMGRCPVCGAVLVEEFCGDCEESADPDYCPTCGGTGTILICPKHGDHKP